jgi:hypothetical protein
MHRLLLIIVSAGLLSGCNPVRPEIGRDLPEDVTQAERIFDARVKARFPVGTDERRLLSELQRQGFRPSPNFGDGIRDASFYRDEFVTKTVWSVRWRANAGHVVEIWGVYGILAP